MKLLMAACVALLLVVLAGQMVLLDRISGDAPAPSKPASGTQAAAPAAPEPLPAAAVPAPPPAAPPVPDAVPPGMSPGLEVFARLVKSGAGEEALLAHVRQSPVAYDPTVGEILYLKDIGTPQPVITALLEHGLELRRRTAGTAQAAPPPATSPVQPEAIVTAFQPPATAVPEPPTGEISIGRFHEALAPYGSWIFVDSAWLWRPTVAVVDLSWRPYCHGGRWVHTDCGWAWHSEYSWGWAPFHYGRWQHHARHGWVWFPDTEWAPAWVSWRMGDAECGWAPLPPAARHLGGAGFLYQGRHVTATFGFGLGAADYVFVSNSRFCEPALHRHMLPPARVTAVYEKTVVRNSYIVVKNRVVNEGPALRHVQPAREEPATHAAIVPTPTATATRTRAPTTHDSPRGENPAVVSQQTRPAGLSSRLATETTGVQNSRHENVVSAPRNQASGFTTRNQTSGTAARESQRRTAEQAEAAAGAVRERSRREDAAKQAAAAERRKSEEQQQVRADAEKRAVEALARERQAAAQTAFENQRRTAEQAEAAAGAARERSRHEDAAKQAAAAERRAPEAQQAKAAAATGTATPQSERRHSGTSDAAH